MSAPEPDGDATLLVARLQSGDAAAAEELLPLVYERLRATAGAYFRTQDADHTLQPTALVHEAYLKLVQHRGSGWEGRAHFCAVAATAMRQILHDHARARSAAKRSGRRKVPMTTIQTPSGATSFDLVALDESLSRLAEIDERDARILELRFFGGLTNERIAGVLDVSLRTVERSWRRTRAWLKSELAAQSEIDS